MAFKYVFARYQAEDHDEFDTLYELLERACGDENTGEAYPLELWEGGNLILSDRDGHPLRQGTTPFSAFIEAWRKQHVKPYSPSEG